jgi:small subunit ribosomal protein S9
MTLRFGFQPLASWVAFSQQASWRPYAALPGVLRSSHQGATVKTRQFGSSSKRNGIAAPEISFGLKDDQCDIPGHARVVPASPSYFTGKPDFTDNLIFLQDLLRKYQTLPVVQPGQAPRVAWKTLAQYRLLVGEPVKAAKYHKIILLLQRLNHIHPSLLPEDVKSAIAPYRRDVNPHENVANPRSIDRFGRVIGVGRRKSSTARVWLVEGDGEVLVNGKSLAGAFSRIHDRESAIWALKATERIDKYNVWALVEGGGTTGQAEAMTLAVAKALLVHEPSLKPALRRGMFLVSLYCF